LNVPVDDRPKLLSSDEASASFGRVISKAGRRTSSARPREPSGWPSMAAGWDSVAGHGIAAADGVIRKSYCANNASNDRRKAATWSSALR
jgi:hypothetical protein